MRTFVATWLSNPLFRKELRIGLRERRFLWMQVIYLGLACGVTLYSLRNLDSQSDFWSLRVEASQLVGVLILLQGAVLLLITPALSSGALSSERERNSLDLLLVGGASPAQIVAGKLMHGLLLAFLLLLGGLPMAVLSLVLGGGTFQGLWLVSFVLVWCTLLLVQYGLMLSARERRSAYATTQTYASLAVGVPLSLWLVGTVEWLQSLLDSLFNDPWRGYAWLAFNLICLSAFFFLKTLNHLEPRARYPRWMGLLFAFWFLADVACGSYSLSRLSESSPEWAHLWCWAAVLTLVLMGCFLNRPDYRTRRDQHEFKRYLGSRWWFWPAFLSFGMACLNIGPYLKGVQPAMLYSLSGLTAALLLLTAAIVRALQRAFPRLPYRLLYFLWLGSTFFIPAVGLLLASGRATAPWWSFLYLSPLYSLLSLTGSAPEVPGCPLEGDALPLATLCLFCYLALLLVIGLGSMRKRSRQDAPGVSHLDCRALFRSLKVGVKEPNCPTKEARPPMAEIDR